MKRTTYSIHYTYDQAMPEVLHLSGAFRVSARNGGAAKALVARFLYRRYGASQITYLSNAYKARRLPAWSYSYWHTINPSHS